MCAEMKSKISDPQNLAEREASQKVTTNATRLERMAKWEEGQRNSTLRKSSKFLDLTGQRKGMLTVTKYNGSTFERGSYWTAACDCGNSINVTTNSFKYRHSCGCVSRPRKKRTDFVHNKSKSPEYAAWKSMRKRCQDANHESYHRYGGRGIMVCQRWEKFVNFYQDIGDRPPGDYSLERINNDKGYEPGNVKWATRAEQSVNKCSNRHIYIGGVRLTISQASKVFSIPYFRLRHRVSKNWPIWRCLFHPPTKKYIS